MHVAGNLGKKNITSLILMELVSCVCACTGIFILWQYIYTGCFVTSGADCTPKNNEKKVIQMYVLSDFVYEI